MKLRSLNPFAVRILFAVIILGLTWRGQAASLIFSTNAPTPGSDDVLNFVGAVPDGANW